MMMDSQLVLPDNPDNEDNELKTDTERLENLYEQMHDLIEICMETKDAMKDLDNWATVHDLEFQLGLTAEGLRRYLADLTEKEREE